MVRPAQAQTPPTPLSQSRWPVRRMPRWLLLAGALVVAGGVLVALPHHPSTAQRAADLRGYLKNLESGVESCAGGVSESLYAMHSITSGSSHDTKTAIGIANYGAQNCSPANNQSLDDLTQYQVSESLASYRLQTAQNDVVTWAFPLAQRVQTDIAEMLTAGSATARARDVTALQRDQRALDAERATIDGIVQPVINSLSAHASVPKLPG